MKKIVTKLIVFLMLFLIPVQCSAFFIDKGTEIRIGQQTARQIESRSPVIYSVDLQSSIDKLLFTLVRQIPNPQFNYTLKVINDNGINAYSIPGGGMYVTAPMIRFVGSTSELSFVIAHELGHEEHRHFAKTMDKLITVSIIADVIGKNNNEKMFTNSILSAVVTRGYGFEKEHEADRYAFELLIKSGQNVGAGAVLFHKFDRHFGDGKQTLQNYLYPHPKNTERLKRQLEMISAYSRNKVFVDGDRVFMNNKFIIQPKPTEKHSSFERAYYIAGQLAFYNNKYNNLSFSYSEDTVFCNGNAIITITGNDETADIVCSRLM